MMKRKECYLKLCCFAFTIVLMSAAATAFGATIRVPLDEPTIQDAIDAAGTGDTVLVADDTYTGPGNTELNFNGKAITVRSENGPLNCIIDLEGTQFWAFRFENNEGPDSVLSGFTIMRAPLLLGTPIICLPGSPTITNCVMHTNGGLVGGIMSGDSSPTITNCTVRDTASTVGPAIAFQGGAPTMTGCTIMDNIGPWTGGIYLEDTSATISGCTIMGNTATEYPTPTDPPSVGGISCTGGSPNITDCTIVDNEGVTAGGIYCQASPTSPTISGCTIRENFGDQGAGGIVFRESSGTVRDCMIRDNGGHGGIESYGPGNITVTGCTIIGNGSKFGGITAYASSVLTVTNCIISNNSGGEPNVAGGITCFNSSATVTNCTITDNTGETDACGIKFFDASPLAVTNCILWGNTPGNQIVGGTRTVTYSDVQGDHPGAGNINADPMLESGVDDYHLTGLSPCIDAGTAQGAPDRDIDGDVRPQIDGYDIGADEYLADNDDDGVPDYLEMGPDPENPDPNYDGNNDGIPDSEQANVFSCPTIDGGNYVTVACPEPAFFTNGGPDRNPYPKDTPEGLTFPFGFFHFTVNNVGPGQATTVTLYLPGKVKSYWKFGPTPDDPTNHWYEFTYDGETGAVFNKDNSVTLHFVDGLRGDHDLNGTNGTIVDPGAPSKGTLITPEEAAVDAADDDDSVCFVGTAAGRGWF